MIIDGHAHIFETINTVTGGGAQKSLGFGKVIRDTGEVFRLFPPSFKDNCCGPEMLLEYMDWAGVDKAVLVSGVLYGFTNQYVADVLRKWSDRFVGAALVDPMTRDASKVLKYAVEEQGFGALKFELSEFFGLAGIHPKIQLDSSEWLAIFEEAKKYQIPLIFDFGQPGMIGYQVKSLKNLVASYPEVNMAICHLGFSYPELEDNTKLHNDWKELISLGKNKNVWLDISSIHALFNKRGDDYPFPQTQKMLKTVCDTVGTTRMYWGSDVPASTLVVTYPQCINFIRNHCTFFSGEEKKNILGENAKRLFKL